MKNTATALIIGCASLLFTSDMLAESEGREAQKEHSGIFAPGTIEWKEGPAALPSGAWAAILEGDPAKEGPFVMRLKMPDGYHIPPHTHPKTERVTVISGAFYLAMGEKLERSAAQKLPTGSYGFWPAGMKHAAWAEGETIVQIHGVGPWTINYVNPADDPRNATKAP